MPSYFLRLEGVNLRHILDDTQDLSTIRGGSLMLLRVVDETGNALVDFAKTIGATTPTPVTTGASIGLWHFNAPDDAAADAMAGKVRDLVTGKDPGGRARKVAHHATFVVDVTRDEGTGYRAARERVIAANRWRQMHEPTLVYPQIEPHSSSGAAGHKRVCALDLNRPAMAVPQSIKGKGVHVSHSVLARRNFGRDEKQTFYGAELSKGLANPNSADNPQDRLPLPMPPAFSDLGKHPFAYHLGSICEQDATLGSLKDKIAVFYADGNSFSKLQDRLIDEAATDALAQQRAIDAKLKDFRRYFLWRLLHTLAEHSAIGAPSSDEREELGTDKARKVVRLETLLWGGDEFMLVVPARLGFRIARLFFDVTFGRDAPIHGAQASPQPWALGGQQLHHAAALVFCHHDAPITRIRHLAKDKLAELAKDADRAQSLLMPMVLESFDHVGADMAGYWQKRLPAGLAATDLALSIEALTGLHETARAFESGNGGRSEPLSRRQLRRVVYTLHQARCIDGDAFTSVKEEIAVRFAPLVNSELTRKTIDLMAPRPVGAGQSSTVVRQAVFWSHIEDLWDYLLADQPTTGSA